MEHAIVAKIAGGTRSDSTDLCKSCKYATIVKGSRESDESRFCSDIQTKIGGRVSECSSYYNKNLKLGLFNLNDLKMIQ